MYLQKESVSGFSPKISHFRYHDYIFALGTYTNL